MEGLQEHLNALSVFSAFCSFLLSNRQPQHPETNKASLHDDTAAASLQLKDVGQERFRHGEIHLPNSPAAPVILRTLCD